MTDAKPRERHLPKHQTRAGGESLSQIITQHWALVIVLFIFVCLAFVYSLVLPLGEAADETDHFALVRFLADQGRPPLTLEERVSIGPKGDASPIYHGLVALLTQHVDVSTLPDLPHTQRRPERFIPSDGFRANLLFHTEDEAFPFHDIVLAWHLARLVSIPLGAATVIAAYLTALVIYPNRRHSQAGHYGFALGVASFVAFLPRFVISSAVVNDDNLVVPLVAFSIYLLVLVVRGNERRSAFVILGALMGLAAITKYHSLVLVPEMTAVMIMLAWRKRWGWRRLLRHWGWTMLAFGLVAGWWFVFLVIQFNQVGELGWIRGLIAPLGDPVVTTGFGRVLDLQPSTGPSFEFGWPDWAVLLFRSFWIVYGWIHVFATPTVYRTLGILTLIAILGLFRLTWTHRSSRRNEDTRLSETWRLAVALLAFHFLVYLSVAAMRYSLSPTPETAQGRHLYPAITSLAFFFVLGLSEVIRALDWLPGIRIRDSHKEKPSLKSQEGVYRLDTPLALGIGGGLLILSALTPSLFILPVYVPYLPILSADPDQVPISHRLKMSFTHGLDFEGYDLEQAEVKAGDALPLTLYWYAGARHEQDYLVKICLRDSAGQEIACRQGHPVDGRYPMRAWEVGYLIRDEVYLPTPYCLPPGEYELDLSVLPLRLDVASSIPEITEPKQDPLALAQVKLYTEPQTSSRDFDLWIGGQRHGQGSYELRQIRQSLTVISYRPAKQTKSDASHDVRFLLSGTEISSDLAWLPVPTEINYPCPNGPIASVHTFLVDPEVRPGNYHLQIGDQIVSKLMATVLTRPRDFSPPQDIPSEINASFAERVKLLGYEASLSPRWPGDTVHVTAYWQSQRIMSRSYVATLHLLDNAMNSWGQSDQILGSHYPNVLWAPGERISEVYPLPIDHRTPAGLYTIEFSVYHYLLGTFYFLPVTTAANPEPVEHLYLGQVRVMDPARTKAPTQPTIVELGNQIQLLGYDLSLGRTKADEPLHLTLHWQAISQPEADYTVFTQVIGPDGQVWAQQDNQPQGGRYPTSTWGLQDKVIDRYELALREGAPPGEYRLLIGMYNLATGQRLSAFSENGERLPDDAIPLTSFTIK